MFIMKRALLILPLLAMFPSCETTGNPREGGLFGWSQDKADVRIEERQSILSGIESDNDRLARENRALKAKRDRLRRQTN